MFPFTLQHNISGILGGKVMLSEMLTLAQLFVYVRFTALRQSTVTGLLQSVSVLGIPGQYNGYNMDTYQSIFGICYGFIVQIP